MDGIDKKILDEIKIYQEKSKKWQIPSRKWKRFLAYEFIPKFENDILAGVYVGASFLVVVLGFRGLGTDAPSIFLDPITQKLYSWIIYASLIFEGTMIGLLGITMFFKPEEDHNFSNRQISHDGILDEELSPEETIKQRIEETTKQIMDGICNLCIKPKEDKKFEKNIKRTDEEINELINEVYTSNLHDHDRIKTINQIINEIPNIINKIPDEFQIQDIQLKDNTIENINTKIQQLGADIQYEIIKGTHDQLTKVVLYLNKKLNKMEGIHTTNKRESEITEKTKNLFFELFNLQ